jgi:hypothetical protein
VLAAALVFAVTIRGRRCAPEPAPAPTAVQSGEGDKGERLMNASLPGGAHAVR